MFPTLTDRINALIQEKNEEIIGIVIGKSDDSDWGSEGIPNYNLIPKKRIISWKEASKWLDYDNEIIHCNAVYAWTKNWVIVIVSYDGNTWPQAIPRNPTNIMPVKIGVGL